MINYKSNINIIQRRQSNFELYRIVCMFFIIAHHYVGAYGILGEMGVTIESPLSLNSIFLHLFGMWGKTGINCFILITGYFMCQSSISFRKFTKLYLWIITYNIFITVALLLTERITFSWGLLLQLFPIRIIHSDNFVSAFLIWWLFIPFLNVLVNGLTEKMHRLLILLMVVVFTIYPFIPKLLFIQINPICWFSTLFIIASYIKNYPEAIYKSNSRLFWQNITLSLVVLSMLTVLSIIYVNTKFNLNLPKYYFVADSQMPLALCVSVSSFMWFRNIDIPYNKYINIVGASTFGVLLIHTHSHELRNWLWGDTFRCISHYDIAFWQLVLYSISVVVLILFLGTIIDQIRIKIIENPVFRFLDLLKVFK